MCDSVKGYCKGQPSSPLLFLAAYQLSLITFPLLNFIFCQKDSAEIIMAQKDHADIQQGQSTTRLVHC